MKMLLLLGVLASSQAMAKTVVCANFPGNIAHYQLELYMDTKTAVVDTIGTRSELKLDSVGFLETFGPQKVYRLSGPFTGKGGGTFKAFYNETQGTAALSHVRTTGQEAYLGESSCAEVR